MKRKWIFVIFSIFISFFLENNLIFFHSLQNEDDPNKPISMNHTYQHIREHVLDEQQ